MNTDYNKDDLVAFNKAFSDLQRAPKRKKILFELLSGKSDQEIADSLGGIHTGTVRKQISELYLSFGLRNISGHSKRAELIDLVVKYKPELIHSPGNIEMQKSELIHLKEIPDVLNFFGRNKELEDLENWILNDKCKLIAVLGQGGIGKSSLVANLLRKSKKIERDFEFKFWFNLEESKNKTEDILKDIVGKISDYSTNLNHVSTDQLITLLVYYLRTSRCLIIFDNFESIVNLEKGTDNEKYNDLIQKIIDLEHKSCFIIASRVKPSIITRYESDKSNVNSCWLSGLNVPDAIKILDANNLIGSNQEKERISNICERNPLILKLVSGSINNIFEGNISKYIESFSDEKLISFTFEVDKLLSEQFEVLSKRQKEIIYWLAINRKSMSIDDLYKTIVQKPLVSELFQAIENLRWRSLIETQDGKFKLQEVIRDFAVNRLVKLITKEIEIQKFDLFNKFSLIQVSSGENSEQEEKEDYFLEMQIADTLKPIADRFNCSLERLYESLYKKDVQDNLRKKLESSVGYAAGNIINLLFKCNYDLSGLDFSNMTVWQADLRRKELYDVNFTNSDLRSSVFTQTFGVILSISFNPNKHSVYEWATGDTNNEIRLWRGNGKQVLTLKGHSNWIRSISFSPNGELLASCGDDQNIKIWDLKTSQIRDYQENSLLCVKSNDKPHSGRIWSIAFSPNSDLLASASEDGTIKIWDVNSGNIIKILEDVNWVRSVSFSANGKFLASGGDDRKVKIWNIENLQNIRLEVDLEGHKDKVRKVLFFPNQDTNILVSCSDDKKIKIWDLQSNKDFKSIKSYDLHHDDCVKSISFCDNGQLLASSDDSGKIYIWDFNKIFEDLQPTILKYLEGHTSRVWSVEFGHNDNSLFSGSDDGTIKIWDLEKGKCRLNLQSYNNWAWSIAFNCNGSLVSSHEDKLVRFWNLNKEQNIDHNLNYYDPSKVFEGHNNRIRTISFSSDGSKIASGGDDGTINIWDINTGQCLATLKGHFDRVLSVNFDYKTGTQLVSGGDDKYVKLWDINTGRFVALYKHKNWIWSVKFSHNDKFLASASEDKTVKIYCFDTGECVDVHHNSWVRSVVFSHDDKNLAFAGEDGTISLLNLENLRNGITSEKFNIHNGSIRSLDFSPDGKKIASAGIGYSVKIWDLQSPEEKPIILNNHTNRIWSVAFNPDKNSQQIASSSEDGKIIIWNYNTGEILKVIRPRRLYEGMKISRIKVSTQAEINNLISLGAIIS